MQAKRKEKRPTHIHMFHMVDTAPWPILTAFAVMGMLFGIVMYMHSVEMGLLVFLFGFITTSYCLILWWRDVVREATFLGEHTVQVQSGLVLGMLLFIVSEVCFFVAFFWAFLHSSLIPGVELMAIWPPQGIVVFDPWDVPFVNTAILLTSGCAITKAHYSILCGPKERWQDHRNIGGWYLFMTMFYAILFTSLQVYEYRHAAFNISDGIYGSTFFLTTGFHGLHVIIGTIFIYVMFVRIDVYEILADHHFGLEAAAWYWHFVDVVWLFLFVLIYCWGGLEADVQDLVEAEVGGSIDYYLDNIVISNEEALVQDATVVNTEQLAASAGLSQESTESFSSTSGTSETENLSDVAVIANVQLNVQEIAVDQPHVAQQATPGKSSE